VVRFFVIRQLEKFGGKETVHFEVIKKCAGMDRRLKWGGNWNQKAESEIRMVNFERLEKRLLQGRSRHNQATMWQREKSG